MINPLARAGADKSAHQAQALWGACQALWSQLGAGDPKLSWEKRIRPLEKEITAIGKAAGKFYCFFTASKCNVTNYYS